MTTRIETGDAPSFRIHSRTLAGLRALSIIALCAALTAAFLVTVWSPPEAASVDATTIAAVGLP